MRWSSIPKQRDVSYERSVPVFPLIPKQIGNQKRWLEFALVHEEFRPGFEYQYVNAFGELSTVHTSRQWKTKSWDDSRDLTFKEMVIALLLAFGRLFVVIICVQIFIGVIAFLSYAVYELYQSPELWKKEEINLPDN